VSQLQVNDADVQRFKAHVEPIYTALVFSVSEESLRGGYASGTVGKFFEFARAAKIHTTKIVHFAIDLHQKISGIEGGDVPEGERQKVLSLLEEIKQRA